MGKQWDKIFRKYGKVFNQIQEDIPKIVKLFKERGAKKILDLGCGTGRHTVYLAKKGFRVYGIDNSPAGIRINKDWLKKEKLKANLKIGDIYKKLPYKDKFFDVVISIQVIHHAKIRTIRKAIKEIERVLKPNGLIFITIRKKKQMRGRAKYKMIASRACIPVEGEEKGLIHYLFNKELLRKEFRDFKIYNIWIDFKKIHYCLFGELKNNAQN